jgi:hypothetical protein
MNREWKSGWSNGLVDNASPRTSEREHLDLIGEQRGKYRRPGPAGIDLDRLATVLVCFRVFSLGQRATTSIVGCESGTHGRLRTGDVPGSDVGSEDNRHTKQPRPRANAIALYVWDRGARDPELVRDGDHDGGPIQKCC